MCSLWRLHCRGCQSWPLSKRSSTFSLPPPDSFYPNITISELGVFHSKEFTRLKYICLRLRFDSIHCELSTLLTVTSCWLTGCGGGSLPRLVSRLRMLLSDICRRADTGGILDSMLGSRVTSAFMSLRSSSSWFSTVGARRRTRCKEGDGKSRQSVNVNGHYITTDGDLWGIKKKRVSRSAVQTHRPLSSSTVGVGYHSESKLCQRVCVCASCGTLVRMENSFFFFQLYPNVCLA